ncbi:MAG: hypothetical protein ABIP45_05610 [Knoellia sp.]
MTNAGNLRERARRWRIAAERTRAEGALLSMVSDLSWRSPSADAFRRTLSRRSRELYGLAEREDSVADLLDRLAEVCEQAA